MVDVNFYFYDKPEGGSVFLLFREQNMNRSNCNLGKLVSKYVTRVFSQPERHFHTS